MRRHPASEQMAGKEKMGSFLGDVVWPVNDASQASHHMDLTDGLSDYKVTQTLVNVEGRKQESNIDD